MMCDSTTLLCLSASMFLISSAAALMTGQDPRGHDEPAVNLHTRCATRAGFGVLCACFIAYKDWMCQSWPVSFLVPICMLIPALLEVVWIRPLSEKAKRPTMSRHSKAANKRQSRADDLHH